MKFVNCVCVCVESFGHSQLLCGRVNCCQRSRAFCEVSSLALSLHFCLKLARSPRLLASQLASVLCVHCDSAPIQSISKHSTLLLYVLKSSSKVIFAVFKSSCCFCFSVWICLAFIEFKQDIYHLDQPPYISISSCMTL